jgi:hypothetical protein
LLPGYWPGMMMGSEFFSQGLTFLYTYPDVFHDDYMGIKSDQSVISVYTLRDGLPIISTLFGLEYDNNPETPYNYWYRHKFMVWIENDSSWTSPVTRFRMDTSFVETLKGYRIDNGLERFPSIQSKLGTLFQTVSQSPLYCHGFGQNEPRPSFNEFAA